MKNENEAKATVAFYGGESRERLVPPPMGRAKACMLTLARIRCVRTNANGPQVEKGERGARATSLITREGRAQSPVGLLPHRRDGKCVHLCFQRVDGRRLLRSYRQARRGIVRRNLRRQVDDPRRCRWRGCRGGRGRGRR
jgi:hypothetical protein